MAIIAVTIVCGIINFIFSIKTNSEFVTEKIDITSIKKLKNLSLPIRIAVITIGVIVLLTIVGGIIGAEIFNASRYNKLITLKDGDFVSEVSEISMEQIPVVDKDTASRLGQRKLGEMSDLVSQFEIEELYTQINYNGKPVRVTPLRYGDFIKWVGNREEGIPAYIMVDMTTQETTLVRLSDGIKYSDSEYFMRDIKRKLRFSYPTIIFDDISFEIDDNGTPYWVASTVEYRIGLFGGKDIGGAVLFNAQTGESKYYSVGEIPTWVDQVYESNLVLEQLTYNGKYRSGWLNSVFGQKGVLQPTDGYNYLAINDDVWLYTGITSVSHDESNMGFILINMRTKEAKTYMINGAEEFSAMESAEGQIQEKGYVATFPILLNVADRPTYFISLKDNAGLVKAYAFVSVANYQIVGVADNIVDAGNEYRRMLGVSAITPPDNNEELTEYKDVTVEALSNAVVDGNTVYYILCAGKVYCVEITVSEYLPFLKAGDTVTFKADSNGSIKEITIAQ